MKAVTFYISASRIDFSVPRTLGLHTCGVIERRIASVGEFVAQRGKEGSVPSGTGNFCDAADCQEKSNS